MYKMLSAAATFARRWVMTVTPAKVLRERITSMMIPSLSASMLPVASSKM